MIYRRWKAHAEKGGWRRCSSPLLLIDDSSTWRSIAHRKYFCFSFIDMTIHYLIICLEDVCLLIEWISHGECRSLRSHTTITGAPYIHTTHAHTMLVYLFAPRCRLMLTRLFTYILIDGIFAHKTICKTRTKSYVTAARARARARLIAKFNHPQGRWAGGNHWPPHSRTTWCSSTGQSARNATGSCRFSPSSYDRHCSCWRRLIFSTKYLIDW